MHRLPLLLFVLLLAALAVTDASAQSGIDEVLTWRSYSAERSARSGFSTQATAAGRTPWSLKRRTTTPGVL